MCVCVCVCVCVLWERNALLEIMIFIVQGLPLSVVVVSTQPLEPHRIAAVPPAVRRTSSHNT